MTPDRWEQIDALLDLALEQEPSRRTAFLLEACAGDELLQQLNGICNTQPDFASCRAQCTELPIAPDDSVIAIGRQKACDSLHTI